MRKIGDRVRAARIKAGLTQEGLARKASMSNMTISKIERGDTAEPSLSTVEAIATALGLTATDLLDGGQARTVEPEVLQYPALVAFLESMPGLADDERAYLTRQDFGTGVPDAGTFHTLLLAYRSAQRGRGTERPAVDVKPSRGRAKPPRVS